MLKYLLFGMCRTVFVNKVHCTFFWLRPQVTAAGDQMARLWDVKSGEMLGSFKGHLCSLKSVAFSPQEKGMEYIRLQTFKEYMTTDQLGLDY